MSTDDYDYDEFDDDDEKDYDYDDDWYQITTKEIPNLYGLGFSILNFSFANNIQI